MFRAALFTIAKIQKQPKCPSTHEWIKMCSIYTMEYYSAIKKNDILTFVTTQMDLGGIMLNEIRQRKTILCNQKNQQTSDYKKKEADLQI